MSDKWEGRVIIVLSEARPGEGMRVKDVADRLKTTARSEVKKAIVAGLTPDTSGVSPLAGLKGKYWLNPEHDATDFLCGLTSAQREAMLKPGGVLDVGVAFRKTGNLSISTENMHQWRHLTRGKGRWIRDVAVEVVQRDQKKKRDKN